MDINLNINGLDPLAAAINNLAAALQADNTIAKAAGKPRTKPEPTPGKPSETAPAAETPQDVPTTSSPASPSKPVSITDVRAALAELSKADKPRAIALLGKYGAASVSSLKEEHYAAVLAEARQ